MQVERRVKELDSNNQEFFKRIFEHPEPYNEEKLKEYLEEPEVEEVHVFKSTPINMKMAKLRQRYPNKTRRELRKMLKNFR